MLEENLIYIGEIAFSLRSQQYWITFMAKALSLVFLYAKEREIENERKKYLLIRST